ncbi:MAG: hypothetical protein GX786_10530 [Clostridiales bacterium]|nr:hypothetical protein [Clostridiales bacterium]
MTVIEAIQRGLILFFFVLIVLSALWLLIVIFSRGISFLEKKTKGQAHKPLTAQETVSTPKDEVFTSQGPWGGELLLENVDEQTAAMIMAIVSDESKIPLSELVFKRISLVNNNKIKEK